MIRNNKWNLLLSSIIILLPALVGLALWEKFPEQTITHGGSGKALAVLGAPLMILALQWISVFFTARDPKNRVQSRKVVRVVLWICPMLSLFVSGVTYTIAFGAAHNVKSLTLFFLGLLAILLGNYMPKCKPNHTIGIRTRWALSNEENWNATHRFGGKVQVAGGLLLMICAFLPEAVFPWALVGLLLAVAGLPTLYSYWYYRQQVRTGTARPVFVSKWHKGILAALVIGLIAINVIGDVTIQYGEDAFTVQTIGGSNLTVAYEDIDSVEYRDEFDIGLKTSGFGSLKLCLGTFENDEFGYYACYVYNGCSSCVVLQVKGEALVINGSDEEQTQAIYAEIQQRVLDAQAS